MNVAIVGKDTERLYLDNVPLPVKIAEPKNKEKLWMMKIGRFLLKEA